MAEPIAFKSQQEKADFWTYVWGGGKLDINGWRQKMNPTVTNQAAIDAAQKSPDPFLTTEQQSARAQEQREAKKKAAETAKQIADAELLYGQNKQDSAKARVQGDDNARGNAAARGISRSSIRAGNLQANEDTSKRRDEGIEKNWADQKAEADRVVKELQAMYGSNYEGGGSRDTEYYNPSMVDNAASAARAPVPDAQYSAAPAEPAVAWYQQMTSPQPVGKITTQPRNPTPKVTSKKKQKTK